MGAYCSVSSRVPCACAVCRRVCAHRRHRHPHARATVSPTHGRRRHAHTSIGCSDRPLHTCGLLGAVGRLPRSGLSISSRLSRLSRLTTGRESRWPLACHLRPAWAYAIGQHAAAAPSPQHARPGSMIVAPIFAFPQGVLCRSSSRMPPLLATSRKASALQTGPPSLRLCRIPALFTRWFGFTPALFTLALVALCSAAPAAGRYAEY